MAKHTHTRKPEAVRAWQHEKGAKLPKWAKDGGIRPDQLKEAIPVGHWLVEHARHSSIDVLSPEQFEAEYDGAD